MTRFVDGWVLTVLAVALPIVVYFGHRMTRPPPCSDQLVLRFDEEPFARGSFELRITADNYDNRCTISWPRGSMTTVTCEKSDGVYGLGMRYIKIPAAPKSVRVLVTKEGVPVIDQRVTPSYAKRSDGDGCLTGEVWLESIKKDATGGAQEKE